MDADEVDVAMQVQALLTRLATSPVQAWTANVGIAAVAVTGAVVKVPQNALASSKRAEARSPRRQLSALQACAEAEARLPRARRVLTNFMLIPAMLRLIKDGARNSKGGGTRYSLYYFNQDNLNLKRIIYIPVPAAPPTYYHPVSIAHEIDQIDLSGLSPQSGAW